MTKNKQEQQDEKMIGAVISGPVELQIKHGDSDRKISRRHAMQWVMAAMAALSLETATPQSSTTYAEKAPADKEASALGNGEQPVAGGFGADPKLTEVHQPGAVWPLTMNEAQKKTTLALCDLIIPADALGPAASDVGVPEMIDDWISAPYATQVADRPVIADGLAWLEIESLKRYKRAFTDLKDDEKRLICDDICFTKKAKPEFKKAASFFNRFRTICASAYYSTPAGWRAVGYVGNVPMPKFEGPPQAVLDKLGVTQTVV